MEKYKKVAKILREANYITVLTGAGISAESGVPTFRGKDGLWEKYDPEEMASIYGLLKEPELVWGWYVELKKSMTQAKPNPAHYALAKLERSAKKFALITQNIDNLDRLAGSKNVFELHGNMFITKCMKCTYSIQNFPLEPDELPPRCPECGAMLRPDIILFGEQLNFDVISNSFQAGEHCDVMLVIGTSGLVTPAANIPVIAKRSGAYLIEINIEQTMLTQIMDISFFGKAGEILPKIVGLM